MRRRTPSDLPVRHQCRCRADDPGEARPARPALVPVHGPSQPLLERDHRGRDRGWRCRRPGSCKAARYAQALAAVRHEFRDRIAPIGEPEAAAYLTIHKTLKAAGTSIDPPDALIAATALANGWTVATRNIKHMARTGALVVNPWEQQL
ncbi:PIN domain-containing protein [Streptomyces sp. 3214.6]|uniref:PIN domain-containing protein n=1 Tax=Streptomyces sp. 3214.6 TaxID=1882757 RepID=UPI001E49E456|nr:PIN domain-containing protein [Streptomyces sp. 3214.6]